MATNYNDVKAFCPFFKHNTEKRIVCEGITEDCNTALEFLTRETKQLHRGAFCDTMKYGNCEVYRMLEKKYE